MSLPTIPTVTALHIYGMPRRAPNFYRVFANVVTWGGIVTTAAYTLLLRMR